jgi:hypothetical protein
MTAVSILSRQLTYVLLPGKLPPPHLVAHYEAAYKCWKDVWSETFLELDGNSKLASNDFTRQDEVSALFHGDKCLGVTFFNWIDFASQVAKEDSYFEVWSPKAISELTKFDSRVLVCSNFTLHPDGRRNALGVSMKDVLMGLLVKRFLDSGANSMTGTVRNNRGVNVCTYRHGAVALERDFKLHGVEVDLVAFYRDTAKLSDDPMISNLVDALWERRVTSYRIGQSAKNRNIA